MKSFFIKLIVFSIMLISFYSLLVYKLSDDFVDIYYKKFTQESGGLIIGISKASKGINPSIIENELDSFNYDLPLVNFALNVNNSKYGDVYFEAIKKKLKPNSKKQLFILSVSPGSFAAPYSISANDIIKIDKNTILGKVSLVKTNPNYNYIVNTYNKPLYNALHPYEKWENYTLHDNGWLEVKLKESKAIQIRNTKLWKSDVIRHFKENVIKQEISNYRINSFIEMVKFLKEKGDVFLVLIPEDKELMALEKNFSPNFESKIDSISNNLNVPFLNYSNLVDKFKTYDGLHFESEGAQEFTKTLSIDIKKHLKTKKHPNFQ